MSGLSSLFHQVAKGLDQYTASKGLLDDPAEYLELFGHPWSKQKEIIRSVFENKRTLVRSCNVVGKTHVAALIALGWLDMHRFDAKVITTAKTYESLKFTLWSRIREEYKVVKDRFDNAPIDKMKFEPDSEGQPEWYMIGISPKVEGSEATAFQGYHAEHILIIVDEAILTPIPIWEAIDSMMLTEGARLLAIYNPTTRTGEVHRMEADPGVNLITIGADDLFNSPEYVAHPEWYTKLISKQGAKDMEETYGRNSAIVKARVYGEYPDQDDEAAIPYWAVEQAVGYYKDDIEIGELQRIIYSWDVAERGSDQNSLGRLLLGTEGGVYTKVRKNWNAKHWDSMTYVKDMLDDTFRELAEAGLEKVPVQLVVDAVGEGSHVPSIMGKWMHGKKITIQGFKAGEKAKKIAERKEVDLLNKISEAWYRARLQLSGEVPNWVPIAADLSPKAVHQLTDRRKEWGAKNKELMVWYIEPKEKYKERNRGKSPDEADDFVMSIWGIHNYAAMRMASF